MSGPTRLAALAALLATTHLAAIASAQPGTYAEPPPPPPPLPAVVVAAEPAVEAGVLEDANIDRAWLTPTAMTQPKGTWSFNDHELFVLGATYGVTDRFQMSAMTNVPIGGDVPQIFFFSAKGQVVSQGSLRLALQGTLSYGTEEEDSVSVGSAGGVASICLDAGCHSMISGYLAALFALGEDETETPMVVAASLVKRLGTHVKLVAEVDSAFLLGDSEDFPGYLGWYGLRFTSRKIAADVGFVKPFGYDDGSDCADCVGGGDDDDLFPMGFPWLNFTYRGL